MIRKLIVFLLLVSLNVFGQMPIPMSQMGEESDLIFSVHTNSANTPPVVTASTLTDTNCIWIRCSDGARTYTKTPATAFFYPEGFYRLRVSDWNKVTSLSFYQTASCIFLKTIDGNRAFTRMTGLNSGVQMFYYQAGLQNWRGLLLPPTITTLVQAWVGCTNGTLPEVSHLTNVTTLNTTWQRCYNVSSFPEVNNLTKLTTLSYTWLNCSSVKNAFPAVDRLLGVNTLLGTWRDCTGMTGIFPVVSVLTGVTTLASAWSGCSGQKNQFPEVSTLTNVTTLENTWNNASSMTGSFPSVSALTNVTKLGGAWGTALARVSEFPDVFALTNVTTIEGTWYTCWASTSPPPMVDTLTKITTANRAWEYCYKIPSMPLTNTLPLCATYNDAFHSCTSMVGNIGNWTWRTLIVDWDSYNSKIAYTNRPGCFATNVKTNGFTIRMDNSILAQGDVDQILIDLNTSNASNGTVNVGGSTAVISNQAPSSAGLVAKTNLVAKGWTVTHN